MLPPSLRRRCRGAKLPERPCPLARTPCGRAEDLHPIPHGSVKRTTLWKLFAALLCLAGCELAEGGDIQPLPPLERPALELRAGLPELEGEWRFGGWQLGPGISPDSAALFAPPGALRIETQRLDSLAGIYESEGTAEPVVGDVRRDSLYSLVVLRPEGARFLAGQVHGDTLWIELTSLSEAAGWPAGTRAALLRRGNPAKPFVRLASGELVRQLADTAAAETLPADSAAPDTVVADSPVFPPAAVPPAPAPTPPPAPAVEPPPRREDPPPIRRPAPRRRDLPDLLGVPVDSAQRPPPRPDTSAAHARR